jgi:Glyoxalase-like domain
MGIPILGSVLVGSTEPDRLRHWYGTTLGGGMSSDGPLDFGGTLLIVDGRDDVADDNPEPGRAWLEFHVDDVRSLAARLDDVGVRWMIDVEERSSGLVGTLVDPDGNHVRVIQVAGRDRGEGGVTT